MIPDVIGWSSLEHELSERDPSRRVVLTLGVFDGMHLGHVALLERAYEMAQGLHALRVHVGFTPHPDLLLRGVLPRQLLDPSERVARMEQAGVDLYCELPFDAQMRDTHWSDFLMRLTRVTKAAGIALSPESAFGARREGTVARVEEWGNVHGLEVAGVDEVVWGGAAVSSTRIREAVGQGDLQAAHAMLGRPYALIGTRMGDAFDLSLERTAWCLPPSGQYEVALQPFERALHDLEDSLGEVVVVRVDRAAGFCHLVSATPRAREAIVGEKVRITLRAGRQGA
jgi:riboflavin kinase/FMN adenylyltransferase